MRKIQIPESATSHLDDKLKEEVKTLNTLADIAWSTARAIKNGMPTTECTPEDRKKFTQDFGEHVDFVVGPFAVIDLRKRAKRNVDVPTIEVKDESNERK